MKKAQHKRKTVILFDTDAELAENIKLFLDDIYYVKLIVGPQELISELKHGHYDYLVLDFNILKMTPKNIISEIYAISPNSKILLMCTFLDAEINDERFILGKVDDYIFKPFNVNLLQYKLSRFYTAQKEVKLS